MRFPRIVVSARPTVPSHVTDRSFRHPVGLVAPTGLSATRRSLVRYLLSSRSQRHCSGCTCLQLRAPSRSRGRCACRCSSFALLRTARWRSPHHRFLRLRICTCACVLSSCSSHRKSHCLLYRFKRSLASTLISGTIPTQLLARPNLSMCALARTRMRAPAVSSRCAHLRAALLVRSPPTDRPRVARRLSISPPNGTTSACCACWA